MAINLPLIYSHNSDCAECLRELSALRELVAALHSRHSEQEMMLREVANLLKFFEHKLETRRG